jgi:hypothetical protein
MTLCTMQHIPLSSAYLCQDCNCVGNCAVQCPACASAVLLNLAGVLDRTVEPASECETTYFHEATYMYPAAMELTSMVA